MKILPAIAAILLLTSCQETGKPQAVEAHEPTISFTQKELAIFFNNGWLAGRTAQLKTLMGDTSATWEKDSTEMAQHFYQFLR